MSANSINKWLEIHQTVVTCQNPMILLTKIINGNVDEAYHHYIAYLIIKSYVMKYDLYPLIEPICRKLGKDRFPTWISLFADIGYKIKQDDTKLIDSIYNILNSSNDLYTYSIAGKMGFPISYGNYSLMPKLLPYLTTVDQYLKFMEANVYVPANHILIAPTDEVSIVSIIAGFSDTKLPIPQYPRPFIEKLQQAIADNKLLILKLHPKYNISLGLEHCQRIIESYSRGSLKVIYMLEDMIAECNKNY